MKAIVITIVILLLTGCTKNNDAEQKTVGGGQIQTGNSSCNLELDTYRLEEVNSADGTSGSAPLDIKMALFETVEQATEADAPLPSFYLAYHINDFFGTQYRKILFPKNTAFKIENTGDEVVYCAKHQVSKKEMMNARRKALTEPEYNELIDFYDNFYFVFCATYIGKTLEKGELYSPYDIQHFMLDYSLGDYTGCSNGEAIDKAYQEGKPIDIDQESFQYTLLNKVCSGIKTVNEYL